MRGNERSPVPFLLVMLICSLGSMYFINLLLDAPDLPLAQARARHHKERESYEKTWRDLRTQRDQLSWSLGTHFLHPKPVPSFPIDSTSKHAIVTVFGPPRDPPDVGIPRTDWVYALVLFQSIEESASRADRIAYSTEPLSNLPSRAGAAFGALGVQLRQLEVPDDVSEERHNIWIRAKLFEWLNGYDKVIFIDQNSIVLQNVDVLLHGNAPIGDTETSPVPVVLGSRSQWQPTSPHFKCGERRVDDPNFFMFKPDPSLATQMTTILSQFTGRASLNSMWKQMFTDILTYRRIPKKQYDGLPLLPLCSCIHLFG